VVTKREEVLVCGKCEEEISETDTFCKNCGEPIDEDTEEVLVCGNCKEEISETDNFCKNCGEVIERNSKHEKSPTDKINEIIPNKSSDIKTHLINGLMLIGFGVIFFIIMAFILGFVNGMNAPNTDDQTPTRFPTTSPTPLTTPPLTENQRKILLVETIAKNYYDTHTYQDNNVFDCDNMAQDVWDMLKAKGINAQIQIGNIDMSSPITLKDVNHAWVMAEIEPGSYLAVETTGGYIVYGETNPNYYKGFSFKDPKNYRTFTELYKTYQFQQADYNNEIEYYNRLVNIYNNANGLQQLGMNSGMQVAKMNLEEKKRRFEETQIKLNALLEYG